MQYEARITFDHQYHRGEQWVPVDLVEPTELGRRVRVRLSDGVVIVRRLRDVRVTLK